MAVSVVYGRAHSGKSHYCFQQIAYSLANGEQGAHILIVPDQFSYQAEQKLTAMLGATGAESAEVLTFSRLAQRVFSGQRGVARKVLSPSGKNMMVCHALHRLKNKLTVYRGSADKLGFVGQAAQVFSEFKRYGVAAQQLFEQADKLTDTLSAQKLSDLALVYQTYDEMTGDGYIDAEDNLYLAAALLAKCDDLSGAQIWVDEFSDFLPQHYAILEALAAKASQLTVCLCCEEGQNAEGVFGPAVRTFGKLRKMCKESAIPFGPPLYLDERKQGIASAEMRWLENTYTDYSAPQYPGDLHDISLYEAANPFEEVDRCAREILALCRDADCRWRDIAVVCGDMDRYGEIVRTVFERYGIACFLSEKPAAISHPFVLTVMSALDIFLKNWDYDSVFAYLKSGFTNLAAEEVDLLENYVLAAGIRGRTWIQEAAWNYRASLFDGLCEAERLEMLERVDALRRKVSAPLLRLRAGIGSGRTVRQACSALFDFMGELQLFRQAKEWVERFRQNGELTLANQYSRIWNGMMEVFDQMELLAGDKKLGMEAFRNMLASGFAAQRSGIIPQSVDQVVVTDVPNGRTCECEVLFILGCNSGCFPTVSAAEGILKDEEREQLAQAGIELAPTMRQAAFDERFLIYKTLTKPTRQLVLSYALADAEGAALLPSPVIGTLRRTFPKLIASNGDMESEERLISAPVATFDELALRMRRMRSGQANEMWQAVSRWYRDSAEFAGRWSALDSALRHSTAARPLPQELMGELYRGGLYTSVSRLEEYSACPFSYFVSFALRAKERKLLKIGPPDAGLLMHKVLELFGRRVQEENLSWNELQDDWCRAAVTEITDEGAEALFSGTMLAGKASAALVGRMRRNLVRCVLAVVDHMRRGQFEPVGCEVHFGEDGRLPSVAVDLGPLGKMKINGVIDRIDSCRTPSGTYYRIVDYKSGSKRFSLGGIVNRLDLQLMVYLDAALQAQPGGKPAGMLYFRLREPMVRADSRPDAQTVAKELQKQMKMDGLVLSDGEILSKMDSQMNGESDILPVKFLKDGSFAKAASVASIEQFRELGAYVRDSLRQIGRQIMNGRIDISPYRAGERCPCDFCSYRSICQFEQAHARCRELKDYRADEAWAVIGGEVRTDGSGVDRGTETGN